MWFAARLAVLITILRTVVDLPCFIVAPLLILNAISAAAFDED